MTNNAPTILLDGSFGEGGGQIVRTALALSAVFKIPCRVVNIRKNRPNPGLDYQHTVGIDALARICNAKVTGNHFSSQELEFIPGEISAKDLTIKIDTAASITLVLQILTPALIFTEKPVVIRFDGGGTDTHFSPTLDHFRFCFLKSLEKIAGRANIMEFNIEARGYYPAGGAKLAVRCQGSGIKKLNPLDLTQRGDLKTIRIISGASLLLKSRKVAERQIAGTNQILGKLKLPLEKEINYWPSPTPGSHILILAEFENGLLGVDALGQMNKSAEMVGQDAALDLIKQQQSRACVDKHLADQILPYLALAGGKSNIRVPEITSHCRTNMQVIEKFVGKKFAAADNVVSFPG